MNTSLDINKIIECQQNAFKDCTENLFFPLSQKVDEQTALINELRRSLEFTQDELQDVKNDLSTSKGHISNLETINREQYNIISKLEEQISEIEDHSRRVNIRIDGIAESPKETWEQTQLKVKKLFADTMQLPEVLIDHAHRIASPKANDSSTVKPRTIIAKLEKFTDRQLVLRSKQKLRNSNIYINDDVSDYTNKLRKEKLPQLKAARNEGKIAYFNRSRLIIKSRANTSNVQHGINQEGQAGGVSVTPPPRVTQLVERFTPGPGNQESESQSSGQLAENNNPMALSPSIQVEPTENLPKDKIMRRYPSRNK